MAAVLSMAVVAVLVLLLADEQVFGVVLADRYPPSPPHFEADEPTRSTSSGFDVPDARLESNIEHEEDDEDVSEFEEFWYGLVTALFGTSELVCDSSTGCSGVISIVSLLGSSSSGCCCCCCFCC